MRAGVSDVAFRWYPLLHTVPGMPSLPYTFSLPNARVISSDACGVLFLQKTKKKSSWAVHVRDRPRDGRCPAPRRWRRQSARRGSQPNGVGILPRNVYQEAELESTPSTVVLTVRAGRLANTAGEGEENWHTLSTCSPKRGKQILTRTAETPPPYRRRHRLDGHRKGSSYWLSPTLHPLRSTAGGGGELINLQFWLRVIKYAAQ
jgi:hypothetical protein